MPGAPSTVNIVQKLSLLDLVNPRLALRRIEDQRRQQGRNEGGVTQNAMHRLNLLAPFEIANQLELRPARNRSAGQVRKQPSPASQYGPLPDWGDDLRRDERVESANVVRHHRPRQSFKRQFPGRLHIGVFLGRRVHLAVNENLPRFGFRT